MKSITAANGLIKSTAYRGSEGIFPNHKNINDPVVILDGQQAHKCPLEGNIPERKIYLTDLERNLTFDGTLESIEEFKGKIIASLVNVEVYEYSSLNPLLHLSKIHFSRPKNKISIEEY